MNLHLLFVDPFTSAEFLTENLREAGVRVSCLYTATRLKHDYSVFVPELFDHCFYLKDFNDLDQLVEQLKKIGVDRIYYGDEYSTEMVDKLAARLCPEFSNAIESFLARLDKYEMQEALKRAGVPYVKQAKVKKSFIPAEHKDLLSDFEYPVFVKPVNSASGDGALCCETLSALASQCQQNFTNEYGDEITEFVVQEYLQGTEYFIDSFSIHGNHFISGVQRYHRALYEGKPICLYFEVVDPHSTEAIICSEYIKQVLTATGLENGLGHTEMMLTDKGPYLLEVNPRISGFKGFGNKLFRACGIPSQIDILLASYQKKAIPIPEKTLHGRAACLQNYEPRVIGELNVKRLQTLPSFYESLMLKKPGTRLSSPTSLSDSVALVALVNRDEAQLSADYEQMIEWQDTGKLF